MRLFSLDQTTTSATLESLQCRSDVGRGTTNAKGVTADGPSDDLVVDLLIRIPSALDMLLDMLGKGISDTMQQPMTLTAMLRLLCAVVQRDEAGGGVRQRDGA